MLAAALSERAEGTEVGLHTCCQFHTENSQSDQEVPLFKRETQSILKQ